MHALCISVTLHAHGLYETKLTKIPACMGRGLCIYSYMDNDSEVSTCPALQTSYSLDLAISNTPILPVIIMAPHGRGFVSWSARGGLAGQHRRRGRNNCNSADTDTSLCSSHFSPPRHSVFIPYTFLLEAFSNS